MSVVDDPNSIRLYGLMVALSREGMRRMLAGLKDQRVGMCVAVLMGGGDNKTLICVCRPRGKGWEAIPTSALLTTGTPPEIRQLLTGAVIDGMEQRGTLIRLKAIALTGRNGQILLTRIEPQD
jgi:hypothetical protein